MPDVHHISLGSDERSEAALALMPRRGQAPAELIVIADNLRFIDAWGATALRSAIELSARVQQQRVFVGQPKNAEAWCTLYHLLATDCPAQVNLTNDSHQPSCKRPSSIYLPAVRIRSLETAERIAEGLLDISAGRLTPALRYLAGQLPELVANALSHGRKSSTDPIGCCFFDRHENELQLVVSDLGGSFDRDHDAEQNLLAAVQEDPNSALNAAVELAAKRGLNTTLTLAAGPGRAYWKGGNWSSATAQSVSGFTAALAIELDD